MRPLLSTLGDYRNLNLCGARRLSYLVQLFPPSFNEKLCEQLLQHLRKLLDNLVQAQKGNYLTYFFTLNKRGNFVMRKKNYPTSETFVSGEKKMYHTL